jgi:SAM-dependent methyltransferase
LSRPHVELHAASPENEQWWFDAHYEDAPSQIISFFADDGLTLEGKRVADVGCGDGLVDLGLVQKARPAALVGFDIVPTNVEILLERTRKHGVADALPAGLEFVESGATVLPAPDASFDIVITWSAFEHVSDPVAVLKEMRRVLTDDGKLFLQLWPFYHSERGSHLWEWCPEPFHHLAEPVAETERRVRASGDPARAELMLREFGTLNRLTLDELGAVLVSAGFAVRKLDVQTGVVRPPGAALAHPLSALAISGVQLLATPLLAHERLPLGRTAGSPGGRGHLRAAERELRAAGRAAVRSLRRRLRPRVRS